jgi:AraC family transcriptional regulator of adaptative response / methylphosphotriester-DNA alkyltransferase methyltransferase
VAQRPSTEAHLQNLFKAAQALLAENPAADVSLAVIARRLATSPRQLERAFAEAGGTTFRAELTAARVRRGARMLRNPSLTVAEVANAVGYRQAPHFGKAFRRVHDMSPAEWRRATYGLGRPSRWDRFEQEAAEHERAAQEHLRRWVAERLEAADREGRAAVPFSEGDLRD